MMHWVVGWSLKFRLLVIAVAAGMVAFGVTQLHNTPVDVLPEFAPPTVEVQTEALGLSAEEVEEQITVPLEADLLNGVAFLDEIRSRSVPSLSSIELIFEPGTDIMDARQVVAERLTQATALPTGNVYSSPPQMLEPLSTTNRLMMVRLTSDTLSRIDMSVLARWNIRPRLLGVPGVANVAMWGFRDRQLQVQVDPKHLQEQGASLLQVVKTAANALWVSPLTFVEASTPGVGGFFETPSQRITLQNVMPITSPKDLAQVTLEGEGGPGARGKQLGDVAKVVEGHQPLIGDADASGLLLVIEKFPGANTLEVTEGVEAALDALRPGLSGIEIDSTVFRPASFLESALDNLSTALLIGFGLLVLALFGLLWNWRSALMGAIVVPLSLLAAGIVLYLRGATVNAMVLAGLVVALVMIIDDAVVDTSQIVDRLRGRRAGDADAKSTARLILEASLEVRGPALYATLILAAAVLPMLLMEGVAGAFLPPLALSLLLAVGASMLVALTLTPALAMVLFGGAGAPRRESPFARWVQHRYDKASPRLHRPAPALVAIGVVAVVGLAVLPFLGRSLAPSFKQSDLLVRWEGAPGTSLEEMNRVTSRVIDELSALPGVRNVGAHVGRAVTSDQIVGANSGELWVSVDPAADYESTVASVQEVVDGYPGIDRAVLSHEQEKVGDLLTEESEPLVVRLYGHESAVLEEKAAEVRDALSNIDGVVAPRIELDPKEPTVEVQVDLAAAQRAGVRPGDVRRAAATLISGIHVGSLFEEQKVFDVVVWGTPETRASLDSVRNLLIDTPDGDQVRLGDVASVRVRPNLNVIRREAVQRYVDVAAGIGGRDLSSVTADVESALQRIDFPLEYHAEVLGGFAEEQAVRTRALSFAVAAAIGILLLLQAAFRSWRLAAVTFLVLPLALVGGLVAALVSGGVVVLGSVIGLLAVLGIATRNSIMLVRRYQMLQREGEAFGPELVSHGTRERAVPILVTAITTAIVLLPFIFFGNIAGLEIVQPMAVVVLGGLVTSTLLSLVVVPMLYLRFGSAEEADLEASIREELSVPRSEVLT